mmetsp:Transcript_40665/g.129746  ORF Transcript_40665/g.129746 Transcript_40665/m.129746 type:complete len:200 (-) Transcript_40665:691-1290(-)
MVSFLGGRPFSTSALRRRRRKGRSTLCSCATTSAWSPPSSPPLPNHSSNWPAEWKTSGRRKLRSAQSSWRLFWRGVPVMSRRKLVLRVRTTLESMEFSFLIRCASSMTMYLQWNFLKAVFSLMTISNEVTQMSKLPATSSLSRRYARSSWLPWNLRARSGGHQRLISFIQLPSVDLGTMIMCGPEMPRYSWRYPRSEMV